MAQLELALEHIDAQLRAYIEELKEWVRMPSISAGAQEDCCEALARAADFAVAQCEGIGLRARKVQVSPDTNPLVVACSASFAAGRPTVLIYGHYDVQGVDNPRSAWTNDPFGAAERDGYLLGRGASDNKGPCFAHLKAAQALHATGGLPVNLVMLIEGEEECGSRALSQFIAGGGLDEFGPIRGVVISDTSMYGPDRPSLTLGLRGILFFQMTVHGPKQDVHSGLFGGTIHNPNHLLVRALAALHDVEGRVRVPGFYDQVQPLSRREKTFYDALEVDEAAYCRNLGVKGLTGEPGYSLLERRWTRPTLAINHLSGGSPRTVIPARAAAVISCRLVPDQQPEPIETALQQYLRDQLPAGTEVEFGNSHHSPAYHLDPDHPLVPRALQAIRTGFGLEPLLTREGGSIPIVTQLHQRTGAPVLLVGLGQITDNWHGPDEHFNLRDFHRGIRTSAALLCALAEV
ncbi:MAG: M20/M25/M40 family metallo-hydrolase [Candidatus Latescibacteria bacterium]|nr:M20/M25/M40 family metallo-hydrolase [Candidatus Latescibacterota bacterium]